MLHDIRDPLANLDSESDAYIFEAVSRILEIEHLVERTIQLGSQPDAAAVNQVLSQIQTDLRDASIYRAPTGEPREE